MKCLSKQRKTVDVKTKKQRTINVAPVQTPTLQVSGVVVRYSRNMVQYFLFSDH